MVRQSEGLLGTARASTSPAFGRGGGRTQAAMDARPVTKLRAALGDYLHTLPLKRREIASPTITFEFNGVQPVYKVFGAMVRERAFDMSEMAIVTYLQAWCCCRR